MFTGKLTEAQISPANRLCGWQKVLLAYPQGTGKSVIAIAAAEKLLELNLVRNVLIVAPTSMAWQWPERIKEFTDGYDVQYVEAKSELRRDYRTNRSLYTVIPYSIFRRDIERIKELHFDLVIADEAQEFSNFRSATYKAIKKFKPTYRWALSGTPIANKIEELYAIMQWVDPTFLPPWPAFEKRHLVRNPHTKQITRYKDIDGLYQYLASKRMVRKTLEELKGQLPELIVYKDYVERDDALDQAESDLLKALQRDSGPAVQMDPEISITLHAARQAASGPAVRKHATNLLERILAESPANKAVVFCFYKEPLLRLAEETNFSVELFTGNEDSEAKQRAIENFRRGDSRVLLCSNAGSTGLDLPFANYVIHLDVPFSHAVMDQRSTRIQRTSSLFETVICYFLLVRDSIDEFYYQATVNKGRLAKAVTEGGEDSIIMRPESLKTYLLNRDEARTKH